MKHRLLTFALATLLLGCATSQFDQFNKFATAAKPIADAAIVAAAASQGVPPGTSMAAITAIDALYGMAAQQWASQPAAQGAGNTTVANAVVPKLGGDPLTNAGVLTAAAQLIQFKTTKL